MVQSSISSGTNFCKSLRFYILLIIIYFPSSVAHSRFCATEGGIFNIFFAVMKKTSVTLAAQHILI